jgi:LPXTG-motif cell wall-anchored protein
MLGVFELLLVLAFFGLVVLGTVFWVWMLIDCATKEPNTGNDKIAWVVIIALTHLIGAALYFFVRRPTRIRQLGR